MILKKLAKTKLILLSLYTVSHSAFGSEGDESEQIFWLTNAVRDFKFTVEETASALNITPEQVRNILNTQKIPDSARWTHNDTLKMLPYPGGRHPRIGFLEGAINPQRGTKAGLFAPWDDHSYVVIDLPEAIFSNLGLLFLAHTHIPTIWDQQQKTLPPIEWQRNPDGSMELSQVLPNQIAFGSRIVPRRDGADMELWLKNGTAEPLTGLRTQICVMLKGAEGFQTQTHDNKTFAQPVAIAKASNSNRAILTAWQHCGRVWGNELVPCIHSDPVLPDCKPGETVRVRGRIIFYEGRDLNTVQKQLTAEFASETQ